MKRYFFLITMICAMLSLNVFAKDQEAFTSGEYEYTLLEDGTVEITNYFGNATELVVPGELDEYAVTSIGESAFFNRASLSSITLPDSLTSIGKGAFSFCASLSSITLPDSLTSIGGGAFSSCASLSSITLPDSLTSIGDGAFSYCASLSSIILPDSIETMGTNPFRGCIISIKISPDHPYLAIIDGVLFSKPDKRLIYYPDIEGNYAVPEGIQSIGESAFDDCASLSSITLPDSLTSIGDYAFSYCASLSSITLPEGLTSIGNWAFSSCDSLSSITLPDSLTSIGIGAFFDCASLTIIANRESYAAEYCKENDFNYTYTDANDWLNS